MKKLILKQRSDIPHWVGDGFPVRSIFTYNEVAKQMSPFLLMDYASPTEFAPSKHIRGVGEHPHRGFETVTIVYSGEVEHRDSAGGGGKIGPGGVQWMTAASGVVHEEMHGRDFAKNGGSFEMVQLWVNLPAKDKMAKPRYQGLDSSEIPTVTLKNDAGILRVIAGEHAGQKGRAMTFTTVNLWDLRLHEGKSVELCMPKGHTAAVFVLSGRVKLGSGEIFESAELGILERDEELFELNALEEAKILILGGEPINEPIVGHGPFVMNSMREIEQAIIDFNNGKMGQLPIDL
jgi:redox-sensitive bicupin YhaK (pirin superfamily)